jgi:hypothetical protein
MSPHCAAGGGTGLPPDGGRIPAAGQKRAQADAAPAAGQNQARAGAGPA